MGPINTERGGWVPCYSLHGYMSVPYHMIFSTTVGFLVLLSTKIIYRWFTYYYHARTSMVRAYCLPSLSPPFPYLQRLIFAPCSPLGLVLWWLPLRFRVGVNGFLLLLIPVPPSPLHHHIHWVSLSWLGGTDQCGYYEHK